MWTRPFWGWEAGSPEVSNDASPAVDSDPDREFNSTSPAPLRDWIGTYLDRRDAQNGRKLLIINYLVEAGGVEPKRLADST